MGKPDGARRATTSWRGTSGLIGRRYSGGADEGCDGAISKPVWWSAWRSSKNGVFRLDDGREGLVSGKRGRSGRRPLPIAEHLLRGTFRPDRHGPRPLTSGSTAPALPPPETLPAAAL